MTPTAPHPRKLTKSRERILWVLVVGFPFFCAMIPWLWPNPFSHFSFHMIALCVGCVLSYRLARWGSTPRTAWPLFALYCVLFVGWVVGVLGCLRR